MRKSAVAFLMAGLMVAGFAPFAQASIIYDITFENNSGNTIEGTGVLTMDYSTLAQAENINTSSTANFVSLVTTNINGDGTFTVTPSNTSSFQFQTGNVGQIFTLTVNETEPATDASGSTNIPFLDAFTGDWQVHGKFDSSLDHGKIAISAPSVESSAAPLPASLPLFVGGLGLFGFIAYLARWRAQRA